MTATDERLLDCARSWIEDYSVQMVGMLVDPDYLTDDQIRRTVELRFSGGWAHFTALDGEYDGEDDPVVEPEKKPYDRPPDVVFSTDNRGCNTTSCLDCGMGLILFDDDQHFCEVTGTSTEFEYEYTDDDD